MQRETMIEYVSTEAEEVSAAESSKAIRLSKVAENGGPTLQQVTAKNDPLRWGISEKRVTSQIRKFISRLPYYLPPLRIFSSHNYVLMRDICLREMHAYK
jgi:hypothetical protein